MKHFLGIAIGGTKCIVTLGREEVGKMTILGNRRIPTKCALSPNDILEKLAALGDELIAENGNIRIDCIGIACGSPLDSELGIIQSPPNLPEWKNIHAAEIMSAHFGVPAFLENDANAGALAEWKYGAAAGCHNAVFLTFGTGLGAGLILNDRLYSGTNGMAGEIGHIRLSEFGPVGYGKAGSAEGFCSGGGISQLAAAMCLEKIQTGNAPLFCKTSEDAAKLTAKTVAEAANNGDELAMDIFRISGRMLGRTLAVLIDILDPQVIVIGGVFARAEKLLRQSMEDELKREAIGISSEKCMIVSSKLGENVDKYEALAIASYSLDLNRKQRTT